MKKTLFEANKDTKTVKAVGMDLDVDITKVRILVNGSDITDAVKLEDLKIIEV